MKVSVLFSGGAALEILAAHNRGEVLSSHDSGVYCRFAPNALVMLHDAARGAVPFGLAARRLPGSGRFPVNAPVFVDHGLGLLCMARTVVDYGQAARWESAPPATGKTVRPAAYEAVRAFLARESACSFPALHAVLTGTEPGTANPWERALWVSAKEFFTRHWKTADGSRSSGLREAVFSLLGLGPGLTPLGDDILVGYMAALHRFATIIPSADAGRALRDIAATVRAFCWKNTTPQSAMFLQSAADGGSFGMVDLCVEYLVDAPAAYPPAPFAALARVGHSSGHGMALGILCAARYVLRECAAAPVKPA